jgi:lysophospholipase L1-like esterase
MTVLLNFGSFSKALSVRMVRLVLAAAMIITSFCDQQCVSSQAAGSFWIPTWGMASHPSDTTFKDETIRMKVHTTVGGNQVRIRLSNTYGASSLLIGAAHIALKKESSGIIPETDRTLSFGGKAGIAIPPGGYALSDPVDLVVGQYSDLMVSVYIVDAPAASTAHNNGLHTNYVSPGNTAGELRFTSATTTRAYYWLTELYVASSRKMPVVVAFGDSITDGFRATPDANSAYPDDLARLMLASKHPAIVLNEGIGGNRVLHDNLSLSALARFDRDALDQPGVSTVILLDGVNDIFGSTPIPPSTIRGDIANAYEIIQGLKQLVARCHMFRIRVIGATFLPFGDSKYYSPAGDATRKAVNQWIRTSGTFDAVLDFDKLIADPSNPDRYNPAYDGGDHLHPGDAGYKQMADEAFRVLEQIERLNK